MCWFLCCPIKANQELEEPLLEQNYNTSQQIGTKSATPQLAAPEVRTNQSQINQTFQNQQTTPQRKKKIENPYLKKMDEAPLILQAMAVLNPHVNQLSEYSPRSPNPKNSKTTIKSETSRKFSDNQYDIKDKETEHLNQFYLSEYQLSQDDSCRMRLKKNKAQIYASMLLEKNFKLKYIYSNMDTENPIHISYKCKKRLDVKDPLQYYFQKNHNKLICLIGLPRAINSRIDTLRKTNELLSVVNYGNQSGSLHELSIDTNKIKCIPIKRMQKIFILLDCFHSFKEVEEFVQQIVENLSERQLKKIIFFFPPNISIPKISIILNMVYKKYISKLDIQRYINQFCFDLGYFEASSNRSVVVKLAERFPRNNYFESIKTSLSILGKNFNHERNYRILKEYFDLIKKRPATDLVLLKKLFKESTKEYRQKIREIRNFEQFDNIIKQYQTFVLENPNTLCNNDYIIISESQKQKIIKHFQISEKLQPDTPVSRQWDDNLQQSDIKLARKQSTYSEPQKEGLNFVCNRELTDFQLQLGIGENENDGFDDFADDDDFEDDDHGNDFFICSASQVIEQSSDMHPQKSKRYPRKNSCYN